MSQFVANLGGTFLYSTDPENLATWYENTLGIQYEHPEGSDFWYTVFSYHPQDKPEKQTGTVLSIFKADKPSDVKTARINYRVHDMDSVINHIKDLGIKIEKQEEHPEGKFAWMYDPDNNYVELWQDTKLG